MTISGTAEPFDATAAAKAADATPFKRPENGVFRPGTDFGEFYFTETGDTSTSEHPAGCVRRRLPHLARTSPSADTGRISIAAVGDKEHTGFDNIHSRRTEDLLVVEDAGDTLHSQRNALDSGYLYRLGRGAGAGTAPQPIRWLAEGRDASATFDSMSGPAYNDGDNEITGIHVSDGDPTPAGLLGAKIPNPFERQLADLLDPAARRQHHVGDRLGRQPLRFAPTPHHADPPGSPGGSAAFTRAPSAGAHHARVSIPVRAHRRTGFRRT